MGDTVISITVQMKKQGYKEANQLAQGPPNS